MRIELFQGKDDEWRIRVVGRNNEKFLQSQAYSRKWNAKRAARRMQKMFPDLMLVEIG